MHFSRKKLIYLIFLLIWMVFATAHALAEASISVSPESFNEVSNKGEIVYRILRITNDGDRELSYQLGFSSMDRKTYAWKHSDAPDGPQYVWNDITSSGTILETVSNTEDEYESVNLQFDFPFYEKTYRQLNVSPNGYVTLGVVDESLGYLMPTNVIGPLMLDMSTTLSGEVRYLSELDRMTIQYTDVLAQDGTSHFTFQIVLESNGNITFYYKDVIGSASEAQVLVGNETMDVATLCMYGDLLKDAYAIRLTPKILWMDIPGMSGTVAAGATAEIPVNFGAGNAKAATYSTNLLITHTATNQASPVAIPCTYTTNNQKPTAVITGPLIASPGEYFLLSGLDSFDPDGSIASYAWDLDQDLEFDDSTDAMPVHCFELPGVYTIGLQVTDLEGATAETTAVVTVDNPLPVAVIQYSPESIRPNVDVTFDASGSYSLNGFITQYAWDLDVDGEYDDGFSPILTTSFSKVGDYPVSVQITDDSNAVATQTVVVTVDYPISVTPGTVDVTTDANTPIAQVVKVTNTGLTPLNANLDVEYEPDLRKGGSTSLGYIWNDSTSGVPFVWNDISETGKLAFTNYQTEYLRNVRPSFIFTFFGKEYYEIPIIKSGYLNFGVGYGIDNTNLPDVQVGGIIAGYYDYLRPEEGGAIYYLDTGNRLIIQYDHVKVWTGPTDTVTFQIVLEADGTIYFYYKEMTGTLNSASIGIEDETRTKTLWLSHNRSFAKSNYAIKLEPVKPWLSLSSTQVTIQPGDSVDISLHMNANGLKSQQRSAVVRISEDESELLAEIPVHLNQTNLSPEATITHFPATIHPGVPVTFVAEAIDQDGEVVKIAWDVDGGDAFDDGLGPKATQTFSSIGHYEIRVQVTDEGGAEKTIIFPLEVVGLPSMSVTPLESIEETVGANQSVKRTLLITNTGESDLRFQIVPKSAAMQYKPLNSKNDASVAYQWRDIRFVGTRLAVISEQAGTVEPVNLSFAFPFYGDLYNRMYVTSNGYITFDDGQPVQYLRTNVPSNQMPSNLIAPMMEDFQVAKSGGVYYLDEGDRVIIQYERMATIEGYATFQIVLERTGRIYCYLKDSYGIVIVNPKIQDHTRTKGSYLVENLSNGSAQLFEPMENWLALPREGTVLAGQTVPVELTLGKVGIGTYSSTIEIYENNPTATEPVRIPVVLHTVNLPPVAQIKFTPSVSEPTVKDRIQISAEGSTDPDGSIFRWDWDLDMDGEYDDATGVYVNHQFSTNGLHTVGLRVTDNQGATTVTFNTLNIFNTLPTAKLKCIPSQYVYPGQIVTLDAEESTDLDGTIVQYHWDFDGDGVFTDATGPQVQYEVTTSGAKSIWVEVIDNNGGVAKTNIPLYVQEWARVTTDQAAFAVTTGINQNVTKILTIANPTLGSYNLNYQLKLALPSSAETWLSLSKVTGSILPRGSEQITLVVNSMGLTEGVYEAKIQIVHDAFNELSPLEIPFTLTVRNLPPVATFTVSPATTVFTGDLICFDASASTDPDTTITAYEWDFDHDGQYDDGTGPVVTTSFSSSGIQSVSLKVVDADGAFHIANMTVNVLNRQPDAVITVSQNPVKVNEIIQFDLSASTDTDGTIVKYEWDFDGDGTTDATEATCSYAFEKSGIYTVTGTVTDQCGDSDHATIRIEVANAAPEAHCTVNPVLPYTNEMITLDGSTSTDDIAIVSYEWDLNHDGIFDNGTGATVSTSFAENGVHTVSLKVTDNVGATDIISIEITVENRKPQAVIQADRNTVYVYQSIEFDLTSSTDVDGQIVSYSWDLNGDNIFGDESAPKVVKKFLTPGKVTIRGQVTDDDGATHTVSIEIEVMAVDTLTVSLDIYPNPALANEPVTFDASKSISPYEGSLTYAWDFEDDGVFEIESTDPVVTRSFVNSGVYRVWLKVTDSSGGNTIVYKYFTIDSTMKVNISASTMTPYAGSSATFEASCSSLSSAQPVEYLWDLDADGEFDDANTLQVEKYFEEAGPYPISLQVRNELGETVMTYIWVEVGGVIIRSRRVTDDYNQVHISWMHEAEQVSKIKMIRKAGSYPTAPTDGTLIYEGQNCRVTDTPLEPGTYYYVMYPYDRNDRTYALKMGSVSVPKTYNKQIAQFQPGSENPFAKMYIAQNWHNDIYTDWNHQPLLGIGRSLRTSDLWVYFPDIFGSQPGQIPASAQIDRAKLTLKVKQMAGNFKQPLKIKVYQITDPDGFGAPAISEKSGPRSGYSFQYRDNRPGRAVPWKNGAENILALFSGVEPLYTVEIQPKSLWVSDPDEIVFDVTDALKAWGEGQANQGLYITVEGDAELGDMSQIELYPANAPNPGDRPILDVVYSTAIDLVKPSQPLEFVCWPGDGKVQLEWYLPFNQSPKVKIVRNAERKPADPYDGEVVYDGIGDHYSDVGLTNGVTYHYAIFAYNEERTYSSGSYLRVTAGTLPANWFEAIGAGPGYNDLLWGGVHGAQSYRIYRQDMESNEVILLADLQGTQFRDWKVEDKQYRYWSVAVNSYGEGQTSEVQSGTPEPGGVRPTPPLYSLHAAQGMLITLDIQNPLENTAAQLIIERRMIGEAWKEIDRVPFHISHYNDRSVMPNTTYEYRIKSVNIAGESEYGPILTVQTNRTYVIPANFTWTVNSAAQVTLKWQDLPCEDYYTVQVLNEQGKEIALYQVNPNTTSWVVPGLSPEQGYYFVLSAYASSTSTSVYSDLVRTYNDSKRDLF